MSRMKILAAGAIVGAVLMGVVMGPEFISGFTTAKVEAATVATDEVRTFDLPDGTQLYRVCDGTTAVYTRAIVSNPSGGGVGGGSVAVDTSTTVCE